MAHTGLPGAQAERNETAAKINGTKMLFSQWEMYGKAKLLGRAGWRLLGDSDSIAVVMYHPKTFLWERGASIKAEMLPGFPGSLGLQSWE